MSWQKKEVERLVSRLPAREAIKERLREELWGHLESIYSEELTKARCAEVARRAACRRLGNADAVRADFEGALSRSERIEGRIAVLIAPVGVVPILRYAGRNAFRIFAYSALWLLVLIVAAVELPGMTVVSSLFAWLSGVMVLALGATSIGIVTYEIHVRAAARRDGPDQPNRFLGPVTRVFVYTALNFSLTLAVWLVGYGVSVVVCAALEQQEMLTTMEMFGRGALFPVSVFLSVWSPIVGWGYEWQEHRARRLIEWPYLGSI